MPEITEEQMAKLEKAERDDTRRKESNRKRTKAISQLVDAHKDEYKQFYDAAQSQFGWDGGNYIKYDIEGEERRARVRFHLWDLYSLGNQYLSSYYRYEVYY